ncbi:MAG TPA: hypothetical protein VMM84_10395 [Pyrinomonadaceae bacterium]|nr:hypothetical protein [Pyrinomonadaceae bacterium]
MKIQNILAESNRGILLDLVIFVINLTLMGVIARHVTELVRLANEEDSLAQMGLFLGCLGMLVFPAAGAVLKRWHFHQRRKAQQPLQPKNATDPKPQQNKKRSRKQRRAQQTEAETAPQRTTFDPLELSSNPVAGCLFNPIFYFCFSLVLASVVFMFLGNLLFGKAANNPEIFIPMVVGSLITCVVLTILVYRYFVPPKKEPKSEFLRAPWSEQLGDLFLLTNMLLFQIVWNVAGQIPFDRVSSFTDFAGRLFFLTFIALLVYFPPRIFFLAEDFNRPITWLTMLLANSPLIIRVVIGSDSSSWELRILSWLRWCSK